MWQRTDGCSGLEGNTNEIGHVIALRVKKDILVALNKTKLDSTPIYNFKDEFYLVRIYPSDSSRAAFIK